MRIVALLFSVNMLLAVPVLAKQNTMVLKAGLNLARQWAGSSADPVFPDNAGMKPGVIIGGALYIEGTPLFSMQPELLFSMKGGIRARNGDYIRAITLSYLELPVLFRVNIPVERAKPNIYTGPALGLRLSTGGYTRDSGGWDWFSPEYKKSLEESTNPVDFGLVMGGGFEFPAGSGSIVLDVRYTLGLVKIFKLSNYLRAQGYERDNVVKDKNGVLSIMLGYAFGSDG
jgi:hypothetical protein